MQCKFDKAWVGKCGKSADESDFCEEHKGTKCCSCGAQATHTCDETGQLVCGAPLCDDCTHNTHPQGHNGGVGFNAHKWPEGMKTHCKKSEQKFAPWYVDEENLLFWKQENGIPEDAEITLTNNP
jgi:hypothetical protein